MILNAFIILSVFISLFCLCRLWIIDLRVRLLPNTYVGGLAVCGVVFQFVTQFSYVSLMDVIAGMVAGMVLLLAVRAIANGVYQRDTLGLGDVKLIGAGGLWLGVDLIFLAISLGACVGILHGAAYYWVSQRKNDTSVTLSTLDIPAGPAFIVGLVIVALFKFQNLPFIMFG